MFTAILFGGCRATRDVAVTSYHVTRGVAVGSYRVVTAPVHYALRKRSEGSETVTTETTSDVAVANQPVPASEVAVTQQQPQAPPVLERSPNRSSPVVSRASRNEAIQSRPKPSPSSRALSGQTEFPTAKAVPGKPGYVVSPFDSSGRYVDVSGYTSGSKVKDPWTDKIFIVP
jgi:hypothetical protein